MAYTKIWTVCSSIKSATDYVTQEYKVNIISERDLEKAVFSSGNDVDEVVLSSLKNSINYIARDIKTDNHRYVTGINCSEDKAAYDMQHTKDLFGSNKLIQAYHCVQSFMPGEITPDQAHIIGLKLANELWGDKGYQVLVSTHIDREHIHNHFVINNVSITGEKDPCTYHKKIAYVSDLFVKEAGYSIIPDSEKGIKPTELVRLSKRCRETKLIVDETLSQASSIEEWCELLNRRNYSVSVTTNRQYWTIKHDDWKRPLRLMRLGSDYSNSDIMKKIYEKPELDDNRFLSREEYKLRDRESRINLNWKDTIQYKYFIANLKIGIDIRQYQSKIKTPKLSDKEEKAHRKLIDKIEYINKNKLTYSDIEPRLNNLANEIENKKKHQFILRNKIRNLRREKVDFTSYQLELDKINLELESLRYEVKLLEEIKSESQVTVFKDLDNEIPERDVTYEIY